MATLNQKQKRWVVERLAVFDSPSEVAGAFYEEFGVRIERQQVNNYDASKGYARKGMAKALVALFDETRERFKAETDGIAIAHKSYRLRRLDENERKARQMGNLVLSNETLEKAAKEVGDAYTNKRRLVGKDDDSPIRHAHEGAVVVMPDNGRGDRALGGITAGGLPLDAGDGPPVVDAE